MKLLAVVLVLAALVALGCVYSGYLANMLPTAAADLNEISLPPGFHITVYAADVPNARQMAVGPPGVIFVGSRSEGKVYAVVDREGGNRAVYVLASGLNQPSGIAFRDGALYVAAVSRVLRFRDVARDLAHPPKPEVVTDAYPSDAHHGWKFIAFGPDGRLYVPVGAPCNICTPPGPLYAAITRIDLAGGRPEVVAHGVRNSVGFDFDPATGDLWFTDNGRDWLSEELPNDKLNRLDMKKPGQHFGYPFCHQGNIPDPEFGWGKSCDDYVKPVALLGPHAGSLGLKFYTGKMFPPKYQGAMFIALHGPWNRTKKYNGVYVAWPEANGKAHVEPFMTGFVENNSYLGRPVDFLVMKDGSLLVTDDHAGAIYRVSYGGK